MNLTERTAQAIDQGQRALQGKNPDSPSGKALRVAVALLAEWLRGAQSVATALPPIIAVVDFAPDETPAPPAPAPKPRKPRGLA